MLAPLRRIVFRMPLVLHRFGVRGFERLLGIDWMVLTTTGRRTGRPHTVMLDVAGRDTTHDAYFVSPADARGDWVRNVRVEPRVEASVGGRTFRGHVREVTGPEGAEVMLRFLREHPWYAVVVNWFVGLVDRVGRSDDELRAQLEKIPVFAIHPNT